MKHFRRTAAVLAALALVVGGAGVAQAEPATVKELDRQLSLNESVLRTKVVRPGARDTAAS